MYDIPKADIRLERYDQTRRHDEMAGLTEITVLVGLVIAYLQRDRTDRVSQAHFQFQITTFWIGLVYFFVGFLTLHIAVDFLIIDRHQMREGSSCLEHG